MPNFQFILKVLSICSLHQSNKVMSTDSGTPTEFIETIDSKAFTGFLQNLSRDKKGKDSKWISITLPIAGIDPLAALELDDTREEKFYWDHPEENTSISAAGKITELKATGSNRFQEIADATRLLKDQISAYTAIQHSMAGPLFLGGYSFNDHNIGRVWNRFGAARFVLPEWMLVKSGHLHLLTLVIEKGDKELHDIYQEIIERFTDFMNLAGSLQNSRRTTKQRSNIVCTLQTPDDKSRWVKKVAKAKKLIEQKKFEKIVLARRVTVESRCPLDSTVMIHNLRQKYPGCYNFLIQVDSETSFVGATPERLASFKQGTFLTEGLAGSISRGKTATEDASLEQSLMGSKKDRSEHHFVVRAINDNLKPFSESVDHPKIPQIKKLNNVQHLFTPISASIKSGVQIHQLIQKLHPTPAVGGFPRDEATPYIQEIEQIERGWYSAPIGWFNLNGCGEFAVAIRSALLDNNKAYLYAGCGIVSDSDAEKEWSETLLKFRPMMDAINQLEESYYD